MDKFKAKYHFSVVLELEIEARHAARAHEVAMDYQNFLLSNEWGSDKAPSAITNIRELSYCYDIRIAEETSKGLTLK